MNKIVNGEVVEMSSEEEAAFLADQAANSVPVVPQYVTMRQARLALLGAGKLNAVDAAISAIPDATTRRAAQVEWEFSSAVERNRPFVLTLGAALGLSSADLDALFIAAAAL